VEHLGTKACLVAATFAVSACGGGGGSPTQEPTFEELVQSFDAEFSTARSAAFSNASSVANAGGTYTGTSQLRIVDGSTSHVFLGDTSLTVDIAAGTVSGTLSGFSGGALTEDPEDLTGSINVVGQSIGVAFDREFESSVSGTLNGASTSIVLGNGTIIGDFFDNPTSSLAASGLIANSELNGNTGLNATLNVQAAKD